MRGFSCFCPAFWCFLASALLQPVLLDAQESEAEPSYLESFLEDTLSSDNQYITVTGLSGAFSSQATINRLTVSDQEGVWLELKDAELDWNRLALLTGAFSVNRLVADEINLLRQPNPVPQDPSLPSPETTPFELPELPVSIEIGEISADRIDLANDVLGFAATFDLHGDLKLAEGSLSTTLAVNRLDRPGDRLNLKAGYTNGSRQIQIDLALDEAAGGVLSQSLALPAAPSLRLKIAGEGPVEDFVADILLASNGTKRLSGAVTLKAEPQPNLAEEAAQTASTAIGFTADLTGDIDPLLHPDYRPFFGPDLALTLRGNTSAEMGTTVDSFALRTEALRVSGAVALSSSGALDTANLRASLFPPPGRAAVVLPIPGAATTLGGGELFATKAKDGPWSVIGELRQLTHPDLDLSRAKISAQGMLSDDGEASRALDGQIEASLLGVVLADPALSDALGSELSLRSQIHTDATAALSLQGFELQGADYQAEGAISFDGLSAGLKVTTDMRLGSADLGRFSTLAGQPLAGAMQAQIKASFTPLSGAFDSDLSLQGQGLSIGMAEVDRLTEGHIALRFKGGRGAEGITIETLTLESGQISARAQGDLNSRNGALSLAINLKETSILVPEISGPLSLRADLTRAGDELTGKARLDGPHSSFADLSGSVQLNGDANLTFAATLDELQRLVPELPGQLTAFGQASRRDGQWQIAADAKAPAGAEAQVEGGFDENTGQADLKALGNLRLEGANPFLSPNLLQGSASFDLTLKGKPGLEALSGQISTSGATFVLPSAAQRLDDIAATISVNQSRAQIQLSARPRDGGTIEVKGPVALQAPFDGSLAISLRDVAVTDHLSYRSTLNADLSLAGALAANSRLSGRVDVGETNINLNTAGGSISAAPIPPIRHVNETRQSRLTRSRAGLIETGGSSAGSSQIALDVLIDAPNRIYARGRGLRAELGGQITLRGSTAALAPSGQISLVRGTFDILGRRLELDEGRLTLLGDLKPYLEFRSTAATGSGSATLEISGRIDAPEIKVTSEPARPSEEALALLLFGDNLDDLSPLALARLAKSALDLSGRSLGATESLEEQTGADKVDVGLDNLGSGLLGIGGYIGDRAYTDFNVNTQGDSELSINLDLTDSVTVTGTVDSQGESGIGIMFKRDY